MYPIDVKNILMQEISLIAQSPKSFCKHPGRDFTRTRKISFADLILLYLSMEAETLKMELLRYFSFDPAAVPSNSAFIQQRNKLLPDVFPSLFYKFNAHFHPSLYHEKYQLIACDGSDFSYTRDPSETECYFPPNGTSTNGYNQIILVALYDILSQRFCDAIIQPGRKRNEYLALAQLEQRFPASDSVPIFIADRGFASYNVFAHAQERGFCFLIRANDKRFSRLLGSDFPDQECFDLQIHRILTRSNSRRKRLHPELEEQYRFISHEVSFDFIESGSGVEYPISLRVLRFKISEEGYENIITNLPADQFPMEEIKKIYHLRWDIETSFRELKYILGASRFHSKKKDFLEMEIWARLILYNFCSIITAHVAVEEKDSKHTYQVNVTVAYKICRHFLGIHSGEDPPDIEGLIGQNLLPVRPERNYSRHKRFRAPVSFTYRF